jgi:hypothetical protein
MAPVLTATWLKPLEPHGLGAQIARWAKDKEPDSPDPY